jgi:hypothetical protein
MSVTAESVKLFKWETAAYENELIGIGRRKGSQKTKWHKRQDILFTLRNLDEIFELFFSVCMVFLIVNQFQTVKNEGPMALYKGFIPTWVRMGPWNIIFFVTYEQLKQLY